MNKHSMRYRQLATYVVRNVRSIRRRAQSTKDKLIQLDQIARRLDAAYTACTKKAERAERLGLARRSKTLRDFQAALARGVKLIASTAKRMAQKDEGTLGFHYDPCYLAHTSWDAAENGQRGLAR